MKHNDKDTTRSQSDTLSEEAFELDDLHVVVCKPVKLEI